MNDPKRDRHFNRRQFLQWNVGTGGLLGIAGMLPSAKDRLQAATDDLNPFAYDVGKYERTDPKLIHYQEVERFNCPRPRPRRLALGPDGALHVVADHSVLRLGEGGGIVFEISLDEPAHCVGVAQDGLLYLGLRDHVEVFDAKGNRKARWDRTGPKGWLSGIAVTDTEVFAADSGGRVLLRYDRSGKLVKRIGERDRERGIPGFVLPSPFLDVERHRDGLLRVNNPGRHRVELYTSEGDFELAWGKPSAAIDGFCGCCNPINLALLPDGRYITCEKGLPRVKIYSAQGEFESVVAGPESFVENARVGAGDSPGPGVKAGLDAVADARGRVFILDLVAADIRVMVRKPQDKPS